MVQLTWPKAALAAFLLAGFSVSTTGIFSQANAQTAEQVTPAETPPEINNFPLSEDFLARMEKVQIGLSQLDLSAMSEGDDNREPSFDTMTEDVKSKPEVMAVLNAEGVEPRAYIVGYFALMSSLAAAEAENEPQMIDELKDINPQHLAFGKQYHDRIQQLLGE